VLDSCCRRHPTGGARRTREGAPRARGDDAFALSAPRADDEETLDPRLRGDDAFAPPALRADQEETLDPRLRGDDAFAPPALRAGGLPRHLRMPRSAEVSASEKAGRANSRSAYFISGAACLGIATA
jgi:hypothetical protein